MNKLLLLACLLSFSAYSMEKWPEHFQNLWCPEMGQPIDAQDLLNHPDNAFWKELSETDDQEQKDNYLEKALTLKGDNSVYKQKRKALACAVAAGADPNTREYKTHGDIILYSDTILYSYSVPLNDYSLTQLALQHGASPNGTGFTPPLFRAKTKKMAQLLIEYKANPMITDFGNSLLHRTAEKKNQKTELISYYVQQGVNINAKNSYGNTPLMTLATSNFFNLEKLPLLLQNGALLNIANNYGETFLDRVKQDLEPEQYEEVKKVVKPYQERELSLKPLGNLRLFISKQKVTDEKIFIIYMPTGFFLCVFNGKVAQAL